jgi:superfamily I DNA and/or RNA helicase
MSSAPKKGADSRRRWQEIRDLRSDLKSREKKLVAELLTSCDVLLATNTGLSAKMLQFQDFAHSIQGFDMVIIDEAAQALEAACWIPATFGCKLVLAGGMCHEVS